MKIKLNLIFSSVFLILIFVFFFTSRGISPVYGDPPHTPTPGVTLIPTDIPDATSTPVPPGGNPCSRLQWGSCVGGAERCEPSGEDRCPDGTCNCRTNDCASGQVRACSGGTTNKTPIGWHDGNSGDQVGGGCVASGWATDPNDTNIDLKVKVLIDGNQFGGATNEFTASLLRNDLLTGCNGGACCQGGTCGYNISLTGIGGSHTIKVQAKDAQTGAWYDLSGTPKTINCKRPAYCQSATVSKTTLNPNESLTITSTANINQIKTFNYAFYNLDNLLGPNEPKGICFEAAGQAAAGTCPANSLHYVKGITPATLTNTNTYTVNYADLDKIDLAKGLKPTKIQVNAYFLDATNNTSAADPRCVVQFQLGAAPCAAFAKKSQGDANNDGLITDADYALWKTDFLASATGCKATDFNGDSKVNIIDFEVWRYNVHIIRPQ